MAHIEGTSQPQVGINNYEIVSEKGFSSGTRFFWRTKSSSNPNDPFSESGRGIKLTFNAGHVGMSFTIEAYYEGKNGKSGILTKTLKVVSTVASQPSTPKQATPDTGNKSAVVNVAGAGKSKEEENKITLKLHVYFDGTFGNRHNIDRLKTAADEIVGPKPDIHASKYQPASDEEKKKLYEKDLAAYKEKVKKNKWEIIKKAKGGSSMSEVLFDSFSDQIGKINTYDPTKDDTSYTQVYTNIPIMFDVEESEEMEDDTQKIVKVYIEGVGTKTYQKEGLKNIITLGFGTDKFGMGIPSKIKRAFAEIKEKVEQAKITKDNISLVEVCVIGFSRGSATTRNFVNEKKDLLSTLRKFNKGIKEEIITYKFVGLFDTVCSVTDLMQYPLYSSSSNESYWETQIDYITNIQRNNVKEFKLALGGIAKEVVHLAAADEFRMFFPLTNIQSSIDAGCGFELVLPGSHCDLGGGDADLIAERYEEEVLSGYPATVPNFLIKNGWFINPKITSPLQYIPDDPYMGTSEHFESGSKTKYELTRKVAVGYNRIPLNMMLHFAKTLGEISQKLDLLTDSTNVHNDLKDLKDDFMKHAETKHGHKYDDSLMNLFEAKYRHLRSNYTHISAFEDGGVLIKVKNMPRKSEGGELCRAILNDADEGLSLTQYSIDYGVNKVGKLIRKFFLE